MLNALCKVVEKRSKLPFSVADLPGQGIKRARAYLRKGVGLEAPFETADWHRAVFLSQVRNAIAHRNGEVHFEEHKTLVEALKKEKHVQVKTHIKDQEDGEIVIDGDFVRHAIIVLRNVLVSVANYELYGAQLRDKKDMERRRRSAPSTIHKLARALVLWLARSCRWSKTARRNEGGSGNTDQSVVQVISVGRSSSRSLGVDSWRDDLHYLRQCLALRSLVPTTERLRP